MHPNLRGMALMTGAMAAFALADALIKALGGTHPSGQIIWVAGIGGTLAFAAACLANRERPVTRDILAPASLARISTEAIGTFGIVTALTLAPLSTVVAIMQSVPLIVTMGAALFLGEKVGWRRWLAIIVGLVGVMIIIRPGTDGFAAPALYAVLAAVTLAARDILTRMVPKTASNLQLGAWGFAGLIPTGLLLVALSGQAQGPYTPLAVTYFAGITGLTALAILFVTMAMRVGDVAVVAPFRYTRLLFGLALAIIWFGERPDLATWLGAAIVVASGLYTFARERRMAQGAG